MPLKSKGDYHTVIIQEIWAAYNIIMQYLVTI